MSTRISIFLIFFFFNTKYQCEKNSHLFHELYLLLDVQIKLKTRFLFLLFSMIF